ncbi:hypothetical protein BI364_16840 [Acidihalobacter yilgarnensis]|uniref:Uncharacterized protein n=1 Tax=Acidihalobacter yilgarnensis TaxID=2819280 RepID=A0A1D8IS98_9GAMM|nr:hypothetical protein [Acidihalobacter yilgarnensis]AOU99371.1 hypothetical protein BI364_16840 [Acidihalobacter yilgarnensis]
MKPFSSYAKLGLAIIVIGATNQAFGATHTPSRVLTAEYALPGHQHIAISIDPAGVTQESFVYGKAGIKGQKSVTYWIKGTKVISCFTQPGETQAQAHLVTTPRKRIVGPEIGAIRIAPTTRQVNVLGHIGREYQISARIDGRAHSWTVILAKGKNMASLNRALNQALAAVGDIQPSHEVAATMRAISLDPSLHGYAPLVVGDSIKLTAMHTESASQIMLPSIPVYEESHKHV